MSCSKVVLSLFDGSGLMAQPWAEAGHKCFCVNADGADHGEYIVKVKHPNITYINQWINGDFEAPVAPDIVFSFPSCTNLAASGAKHGERVTDDDMTCALMGQAIGNRYNVPWMTENPVGKLCTLWRRPDLYFDPWEFGGYMTGSDEPFHPKMPKFDGYTKRTGIWRGNGFKLPVKRPGPVNVGFFWGWKYLGGASPKTKQLRSLTPRGFARAVYEANK